MNIAHIIIIALCRSHTSSEDSVLRPNCVYSVSDSVRDIKPRNDLIHKIICNHLRPLRASHDVYTKSAVSSRG